MNEMVPLGGLAPKPSATDNRPSIELSRRAKAAIVVRLLLNKGAEIPLEDLPEDLQANLTHQMGNMRMVDRDTLAAVVAEFSDEMERIGLSFPVGIAGALDALDGKISPQTASRLRKEAGVRRAGDPWERIKTLHADQLLPVLENESVEVAAVMLSKLPVALAAELLGRLPGPQARRITYAVSMTGAVTPDAVDRIGLSLASLLDARPVRAFDSDPVARVGAILNSSTTVTRDDVLDGLDETDQGFANLVRKTIFTFANIPTRIAARDIPRILRDVDQDKVVLALAGSAAAGYQATMDFILENMSGRMADQLREEISEAGKVKPEAAEKAMAEIVAVIRGLEQDGDLVLLTDEDDDIA